MAGDLAGGVAVVTGANKGIGLAVVRGLLVLPVPPAAVYLTSRDPGRGAAAVDLLKAEGLQPLYHQLNTTDPASVAALATHLLHQHGGLDILVNNAGIAYKRDSKAQWASKK